MPSLSARCFTLVAKGSPLGFVSVTETFFGVALAFFEVALAFFGVAFAFFGVAFALGVTTFLTACPFLLSSIFIKVLEAQNSL